MRTATLVTSYIQAGIFAALALRCFFSWSRERDRRSGHLAWAAGLFGANSLMSAVVSTIYDATKGQMTPRWESALSTVVIFLSIYAFLLFLSDFVSFPRWLKIVFVGATALNIVLSVVERPDLRFDAQKFQIVAIPGVHNPISYHAYLGYVLAYLAVSLGVLAMAFLIYALRTVGLARLRMALIGTGFLLLCVVIGLLPRLLFGHPSAHTIMNLLTVLEYVALATGPLLLLGFVPPEFVKARFRRLDAGRAGRQQAPAM